MSNKIIYFLLDKYIDSKTPLSWSLKLGQEMGFQSFDTTVKELLNPKRGKKLLCLFITVSVGKMIFNKQV